MKTKIYLIIAAVIILSLTLPARAELITIAIEATVDIVEDYGDYLEGQISPGSIITGYYTYESTTPDTNPSGLVGDYWHYSSPCGIFLSVGGFNFQTDLTNVNFLVEIVNNNAGIDGYLVRSYNNLPLSNSTIVDYISWVLQDYTMDAISTDALPLTIPILEDWPSMNDLRLESDRNFLVDAHVTSAVLVPEPATLLFLAFGALILRKTN